MILEKQCTNKRCLKVKPISEFYKDKRYADGYFCWCKDCKKGHARDNPHIVQNWVKANRERSNEIKRAYAFNNTDKVREAKRIYEKANPGKVLAKTRKYQTSKIHRTPKWLSKEQLKQIEMFYINRPKGFHVDHIVPLQGKNVSGLHVPWNLQYLKATPNLKKSNKY